MAGVIGGCGDRDGREPSAGPGVRYLAHQGGTPGTGSGRLAGVTLLLNVLWFVLAGFWLALGYLVAGIVCCVLVVTIPFGLASFRIARYALWPFGRTITERRDAGLASLLGNALWLLLAGWWIALFHLTTGLLLCITIIGIPLGVANIKLVPVALFPLGREIVAV